MWPVIRDTATIKLVMSESSKPGHSSVVLPQLAPRPIVRLVEDIGSIVARSLSRIDIPRRPEGFDQRPDLPVVFIGNHRSLFDVVIGMRITRRWNAPARMMVKGEFFQRRLSGFLLRTLGAIPVHSGRGAKAAFDQAALALQRGESIIIMPEARVVPADERPLGTADLVSTVGRLVATRECRVVVSGLIGADDVWPIGSTLPRIRPWQRPSVRIRSMVLSDLHLLPPKEITARLQSELRGIVNRMEGRVVSVANPMGPTQFGREGRVVSVANPMGPTEFKREGHA
jgi:1-acyl-sn-glycerol-3-phosphate acyltransferase